ncbi:MAG: hypothetical protein CVV60_05105 [Tenericutes bacterium HGW-Tenericutes-5]|jgi:uncharacterized protein YxjI|nr:MAG: hypothetical protein CVV60_05105 [Tenericutes bacterium HGW-Tenericutes-5]
MRFYIKQKVFSLKDKFNVFDESQNQKYQVKGKFLSLKNKLELQDMDGKLILHSNRKLFTFLPKYYIYDQQNQEVAVIKKKFSLFPKFNLTVLGKELKVDGKFFAHNFSILDNTLALASISKRIISWGDTYEIDIAANENVEIFLFVVIIIDQTIHEKKNR